MSLTEEKLTAHVNEVPILGGLRAAFFVRADASCAS